MPSDRDDMARRMHVYSPEGQVTHCGCRLCGERQAVVRAAREWANSKGKIRAWKADELEAAVAALPGDMDEKGV